MGDTYSVRIFRPVGPGPNPQADMDSPTELSENIILNVLGERGNT